MKCCGPSLYEKEMESGMPRPPRLPVKSGRSAGQSDPLLCAASYKMVKDLRTAWNQAIGFRSGRGPG